jgi:hypothetical protein
MARWTFAGFLLIALGCEGESYDPLPEVPKTPHGGFVTPAAAPTPVTGNRYSFERRIPPDGLSVLLEALEKDGVLDAEEARSIQEAADEGEWAPARDAALDVAHRADPRIAQVLRQLEAECTRSARLAYKKAQIFESIENDEDARDQCRIAMTYHPRADDPYHIKCTELISRLR